MIDYGQTVTIDWFFLCRDNDVVVCSCVLDGSIYILCKCI